MPEPMGFFTDTTVCIGCKACEVACKEWNQLPAANGGVRTLSGNSYDNTRHLDGIHWRHVKFIEQFSADRSQGRWLMMSDVCKHCVRAGCLEVCPTGAIIRTEFDTVVIQSDTCNGCRDCIGACPFGVIEINPVSGTAQKCTLCYDRMKAGLEPACAKACPTKSINFGTIVDLKTMAQARMGQLHQAGERGAYLYGTDEAMLGGLNSFLSARRQARGLRATPGSQASVEKSQTLRVLVGVRRGCHRLRELDQLPESGKPAMISSTFFTASPHWRWFIVGYFFLGGLAAGSYFLATLMDLVGRGRHRRLIDLGYFIAFPLVCVCGVLLTIDLGRPERFWHMLIQSETLRPMLKTYSPMSSGAWALLLFGGCAFLSFVAVLADRGWLRWPLHRLSPSAPVGRIVTIIGTLFAFYVAGYTGVLLSVTNRPIWADTNLLGLAFFISAASTSAALLALVGSRDRLLDGGIDALERFDIAIVALEVLVIVALVASLGPVAVAWLNGWGVLLAVTMLVMVLGGIVLPLSRRVATRGVLARAIGPTLVLLTGFIVRAVIIFSVDTLS